MPSLKSKSLPPVSPYAYVPEVGEREGIYGLDLPNPYEMVLETAVCGRIEVPWDFARHYCDASYRPSIEAVSAVGRQAIGERVRRFRESAGLTQEALAQAAGIGRITVVRLEHGDQSPRLKTLQSIAGALGMGVHELLVKPDC